MPHRRPRPCRASYQNCLRRMTKVWNTSQTSLQNSIVSEERLGALCCRSEAHTVPRLLWLLQMGAVGWLRGNSSHSSTRSAIRTARRKTRLEGVPGRRRRKAWPEGVAGRRGRKAWPEGVVGRCGRKAWYEGMLGIAGGEGRVSWPRLKGISGHSEEGLSILVRAEGELERLFGGSDSRPKNWISCSVRWRRGFPRTAGPLVLSSGCWVHDGFQMLSCLSDAPTLTTRCRCRAAAEHRINIAHLVLHPIWNGELSSGKESQKGHNTVHDLRGRQDKFMRRNGEQTIPRKSRKRLSADGRIKKNLLRRNRLSQTI